MSDLRPPATGTEAYLAAILVELRALRVAVEGGRVQVGKQIDEAFGQLADSLHYAAPTLTEITAATTADNPTKRTRTRPRPGG